MEQLGRNFFNSLNYGLFFFLSFGVMVIIPTFHSGGSIPRAGYLDLNFTWFSKSFQTNAGIVLYQFQGQRSNSFPILITSFSSFFNYHPIISPQQLCHYPMVNKCNVENAGKKEKWKKNLQNKIYFTLIVIYHEDYCTVLFDQ